jgi:hypothetical protein
MGELQSEASSDESVQTGVGSEFNRNILVPDTVLMIKPQSD